MPSPDVYLDLDEASRVSGLEPALLWATCDRLGLSEDAIPSRFATELGWYVHVLLDNVIRRVNAKLDEVEAQPWQ